MSQSATAIRRRPWALLAMVLVAVLGLAVGCGGTTGSGEGGGSAAAPAANTVVIKSFAFQPDTLTVAPGTKITVLNQDQASHTVTADDKSFDTGKVAGGQRAEITAPGKPGKYSYVCSIHQYMTGTLTVK
ncbi:MAG TPA: cupredoxin domain-containing protein [Pseudonocardiaceae bacterium]|jgi:plastocyanin